MQSEPSAHRIEHRREGRACVFPDASIAVRLAQRCKLFQHFINGFTIRQQQRLEVACLHLQHMVPG